MENQGYPSQPHRDVWSFLVTEAAARGRSVDVTAVLTLLKYERLGLIRFGCGRQL